MTMQQEASGLERIVRDYVIDQIYRATKIKLTGDDVNELLKILDEADLTEEDQSHLERCLSVLGNLRRLSS